MNNDKARALVLNAIDVPSDDHKAANDVMGVQIKAYPHLAEKLAGMAELQTHASEITGWLNSKRNGPTTIQQVIDFIRTLDIPDNSEDQQQNKKPQQQPQQQQDPATPQQQPQPDMSMGGAPPPQQQMQMAHRIWFESQVPPRSLPEEGQVEYMGFLLSKYQGTNVGYGGTTHKIDSRGKTVSGPFDASKHSLRQSTRKVSGVSVVNMEDNYERVMSSLREAIKFIHQYNGIEG
jgi:hypothetical protein